MKVTTQVLVMRVRRTVHNYDPEWFTLQRGGPTFVIHCVPQDVGMQVRHVRATTHFLLHEGNGRTRYSLFVILHPPEHVLGFVAPGKIIQTGSFIIAM